MDKTIVLQGRNIRDRQHDGGTEYFRMISGRGVLVVLCCPVAAADTFIAAALVRTGYDACVILWSAYST